MSGKVLCWACAAGDFGRRVKPAASIPHAMAMAAALQKADPI
jgi:hypothetical protein